MASLHQHNLSVPRALGFQRSRNLNIVCRLATKRGAPPSPAKVKEAEQAVLAALGSVKGRGKSGMDATNQELLNVAVEVLERDGVLQVGYQDVYTTLAHPGWINPTALPQIDGRWKLLYTSRPGTASPIQRTFVGVEAFKVFQEVQLLDEQPRVNNVVDFGNIIGYLKVQAEASTESRPLPGFTPRQGAGLPLFGKSFNYPPSRPNSRIDFQFDQAAFYFKFLPFTIPYPVPFRILGDERKGWIDTTYMNEEGSLRLARGNKGTLFVLAKDVPVEDLKQRLMTAIQQQDDPRVLGLLALMEQSNPTKNPARSKLVSGTWRLVWSQQAENASPLQKWGTKQSKNYQVIDAAAGTLENVVDLGITKVRAQATCQALSEVRTDVAINGAGLYTGPVRVPLGVKGTGYVDWLYLDDELRVTRGSKGSLFVHIKDDDAKL